MSRTVSACMLSTKKNERHRILRFPNGLEISKLTFFQAILSVKRNGCGIKGNIETVLSRAG